MVTNRNILKKAFPDFKFLNMQGNLFVMNFTKEEVEQRALQYKEPYPLDYADSKYKKAVYAEKYCYLIGGRKFEIKDSKRGNGFYFFEI